jgi:OTU domain-containing protein 6
MCVCVLLLLCPLSGEPELLMASRVLQRPICVYQAAWGGPQYILTYGEEYQKSAAPMHLLWSGAHYDLLLPQPNSKL